MSAEDAPVAKWSRRQNWRKVPSINPSVCLFESDSDGFKSDQCRHEWLDSFHSKLILFLENKNVINPSKIMQRRD